MRFLPAILVVLVVVPLAVYVATRPFEPDRAHVLTASVSSEVKATSAGLCNRQDQPGRWRCPYLNIGNSGGEFRYEVQETRGDCWRGTIVGGRYVGEGWVPARIEGCF